MASVRNILDFLGRDALARLAGLRVVGTAHSLSDRRAILAYSYHGDLASLINDLRREDLLAVLESGVTIDDQEYVVPGLARMSADDMRDLALRMFVKGIKPRALAPQRLAEENDVAEAPGNGAIKLLSTHYKEAADRALDIGALQTCMRSARRISLAAAYYDDEFVESLLAPLKGQGRRTVVRLLFNGLSGARLQEQLDSLRALEETLKRRCKDLEIRLKFEPGIFHTKLLVFDTATTVAFVGSLNATTAAVERNEEVMIRLQDAPGLKDYFDHVWDRARPIAMIEEPVARSLVGFFRMGTLYFKPVIQLQVTYNPFTRLLALLPDQLKERLLRREVTIPNAEAEAGIGAFSVKRALGIAEAEPEEGESEQKKNPPISTYGIETCLGYWVPTPLSSEFDEKLGKAADRKRGYYTTLATKVASKGDSFFQERFEQYRDAVAAVFKNADVDPTPYLKKLDTDPFCDADGFKSFLKKLRARLTSEDVVDRLSRSFVKGPMPEIWDDRLASDEFQDSFFAYLEYVVNRPGTSRRVASIVQKECGYGVGATSEEIGDALIRRLDDGWRMEDWGASAE